MLGPLLVWYDGGQRLAMLAFVHGEGSTKNEMS